jgi:hypothetical protein
MPQFTRYIGIDYSGAVTPESSCNGIRVFMADGSGAPAQVQPPPSPRRYWTRQGLAEWLREELDRDIPSPPLPWDWSEYTFGMKDELLTKLQGVLDQQITTEMQVVYLLVELRKLMDRVTYKDPVLRTLCNWVVHSSLEQPGEGSRLVLTEIDDQMVRVLEHNGSVPSFEHLSFGAFRSALGQCFETFGLSAKFIKDKIEYQRFVGLYSSIVSECPIFFSASKTKLKYVKNVKLEGIEKDIIFDDWPVLQWRVTLTNGREMNWAFPMG